MVDRLGDTLVQTWTLEWSGGNLVRATADSMAWYCTGISWIDYYYDNHPNSLQGLFFASQIFDGSFVDEPTSLCRNNLVRRVIHCTNHDEISSIESLWKYTYGPMVTPLVSATPTVPCIGPPSTSQTISPTEFFNGLWVIGYGL